MLGLLSNIKSNEAWIEELHDDMESILKAIEAERVRAQKMSRRMFIGTSVVAAASAAGLYRAGVFDKTETKERELLENFLSPSEVPLTRKEIEVILYDIEDKDGTVGRAVHIGGNYFITANHVVSRGVVGKRLLPQHRRGYQWDFSSEFNIIAVDKRSDLALLKTNYERVEYKPRLHISNRKPMLGESISEFTF